MLKPDTTALEISCSQRCGERGITLHGLSFKLKPQTLPLSQLDAGVAEKLLRHPELMVKQLERSTEVLPGVTPAESPKAKAGKSKTRKKKD